MSPDKLYGQMLYEPIDRGRNGDKENAKFQGDRSVNHTVTFCEVLENSDKPTKPQFNSFEVSLEDFDEHSNISEKLQAYEYENQNEGYEELTASKSKMDPEAFKFRMTMSQLSFKNLSFKKLSRARTDLTNALDVFGLNSTMDRIPPKELDEKESPKFSTFSEHDTESKNPKKRRKRVLSLNDNNTEAKTKNSLRKLNYKRCLLVDVNSELKSKLAMICQTLNCSLEIAKDLEDARVIYESFVR